MEKDKNKNCSVLVPVGYYFLGDPSLFIEDKKIWDEVLKQTNNFMDTPVYQSERGIIVAFNTSEGVGDYKDNYDVDYRVESGLIGLVSFHFKTEEKETPQYVQQENKFNLLDSLKGKGRSWEFDKPFFAKRREDMLVFGNVIIDTGVQYDEDVHDDLDTLEVFRS